MKIKALWGFVGNAEKLNAESPQVRTGDEFDDVDKEYGSTLIGKGLAEEVKPKAAPASNKQAKAGEVK